MSTHSTTCPGTVVTLFGRTSSRPTVAPVERYCRVAPRRAPSGRRQQRLRHAASGGTARDLLHHSPRLFGQATSVWTLELAADAAYEQGLTAQRVSGVTIA
jgi:hypothetical protein